MNPRSARRSIAAQPVLIGSVSVLVVVVAVFLSYNANSGLPFVPTYSFKAAIPNAQSLLPGNDVRVAGNRVGQVTDIVAEIQNGKPVAIVSVKVEESLKPLPRDTKLLIRQRSNVGLKYLELSPGTSRVTIPEGGSLPTANVTEAVDLRDVLETFDPPTRKALRGTISSLGTGLAGRGTDLNNALQALPSAFADLDVVMRTLASPSADLDGFIKGLGAAAAAVAPHAEALRDVFDDGATTFGALAAQRVALGATIDRASATERAATQGFAALDPALAAGRALIDDAAPGVRRLRVAGPVVARALRVTGPVLSRGRRLLPPLDRLVARAHSLSRSRDTTGALQRLTDTVTGLTPLLSFVNPFQTRCNAIALWSRNLSSLASEGTPQGTWFRFLIPSNPGELLPHATPTANLHVVTTPDNGQNGECESGNTAYEPGQRIGEGPGRQPGATDVTSPGTIAEMVAREGR